MSHKLGVQFRFKKPGGSSGDVVTFDDIRPDPPQDVVVSWEDLNQGTAPVVAVPSGIAWSQPGVDKPAVLRNRVIVDGADVYAYEFTSTVGFPPGVPVTADVYDVGAIASEPTTFTYTWEVPDAPVGVTFEATLTNDAQNGRIQISGVRDNNDVLLTGNALFALFIQRAGRPYHEIQTRGGLGFVDGVADTYPYWAGVEIEPGSDAIVAVWIEGDPNDNGAGGHFVGLRDQFVAV